MKSFKDFLLNEQKFVSVDADDPNAAKKEIDRASAMDGNRLASKEAAQAQDEKQAASKADANDPASRLKQRRASIAAQLAQIDKQIAQQEKRA